MANVTYLNRGATTDVMIDGLYVGAIVETAEGFVTVHKNNAVSQTFAKHQKHFALYHVEKA